jgi:hypothetical protein
VTWSWLSPSGFKYKRNYWRSSNPETMTQAELIAPAMRH